MQELAVREPQQITAADALHWLNAIENDADRIIHDLPARTDDEVLEIRMAARSLGRASWRIECAADAEIMNRVSARVGRGNKDENGDGRTAKVLEQARKLGISPRTVFKNAAIHKTFFEGVKYEITAGACSNLDLDLKEFYVAALTADDPHSALERIAQRKIENPEFSTADAWQLVREMKAPPVDARISDIIDNEKVARLWQTIRELLLTLSGTEYNTRSTISIFIEEMEYLLTTPSGTYRQAIHDAIIEGYDELDQIAERLNRHRDVVRVWLNQLADEGELEWFEKPHSPGGRGPHRQGVKPRLK